MTVIALDKIEFSSSSGPILVDVSFKVNQRDFFVIIGPNGAGKTTLLKIISAVIKPQQGKITIFDRPLAAYSRLELSRIVALVPQQETGFPFTVEETVLLGRSPHLGLLTIEGKQDFAIARQAMEITGIDHLADRRLDQVSGGELQRVIIARAICQQPRIMLLDEPTAALDPAHQLRIMDIMEQLRREQGMTIIMVSHDLNLAALYGTKLLLIKDGKVRRSGKVGDVLQAEQLKKCYGCDFSVETDSRSGMLRIMPVPAKLQH